MSFASRVAYAYDRARAHPPEVSGQVAGAMAAELAGVEDPVFLELGVGTGRIALPLIARGYRYLALDRDPAMLEVFRQKVAGVTRKVRILQADAREVPLEDESVDAVVVVHLWHLLEDWPRALAEALRVLRPGGVLLEGWDEAEASVDLRVQEVWRRLVAEEGVEVERGRHKRRLSQVEAALKDLGLAPKAAVVARWTEERSLRQSLENLQEQLYSFTWGVPEEVHRRAMERLYAWAEAEYQDLDRTFPISWRFVLRSTRLA
ncbi:class I SAM-dependent methyltransferase [Thermus filiformis]|uniref:Methyltransferase n=1 Tax=Thermus filiformis TaxID=276 RepID=A0A0A2WRL5_THEFI|nr:class I SAM-dependent methyltransferase [Thermus filiformis]KGQ22463.1 methyltransferase [Thermus filiformis]